MAYSPVFTVNLSNLLISTFWQFENSLSFKRIIFTDRFIFFYKFYWTSSIKPEKYQKKKSASLRSYRGLQLNKSPVTYICNLQIKFPLEFHRLKAFHQHKLALHFLYHKSLICCTIIVNYLVMYMLMWFSVKMHNSLYWRNDNTVTHFSNSQQWHLCDFHMKKQFHRKCTKPEHVFFSKLLKIFAEVKENVHK